MIETKRLILRRWASRDRPAFAALNGDEQVMRHFPKCLTPAESDALLARIEDRWTADEIAFGAAERRIDGALVGMAGLARVHFELPNTPPGGIEIGWRFAPVFWGQGYATEAALAWRDYAFRTFDIPELVAFAVPENYPSHAVMRRIGLRPDPARSFEHPLLPEGHRLRPHVLHAMSRAEWEAF